MEHMIIPAVLIFFSLFFFTLLYFYIDFHSGTKIIKTYFQNLKIDKIKGIGTTKNLEIIPLIDWYADKSDLKSEAGLSYLIKTDDAMILFDLGLNSKGEMPSPLMHNMKKLGVDFDKIDIIVISHKHPDHIGGLKKGKGKSFLLPTNQPIENNKKIYTPLEMTYPGLNPIYTEQPTVISKGVATTGIIPSYLFFAGLTPEQSLAINVEGKGIVLIVGCGHSTVIRIVERAVQLFDKPIYGILGGLHFPVSESRFKSFGIPLQKVFATGKPPWRFITSEDVSNNISFIKKFNPQIIALSAHDSCDETINKFKEAFPSEFQEIKVGRNIKITH